MKGVQVRLHQGGIPIHGSCYSPFSIAEQMWSTMDLNSSLDLGLLSPRQSSGTCSAGAIAEEATCVPESTCPSYVPNLSKAKIDGIGYRQRRSLPKAMRHRLRGTLAFARNEITYLGLAWLTVELSRTGSAASFSHARSPKEPGGARMIRAMRVMGCFSRGIRCVFLFLPCYLIGTDEVDHYPMFAVVRIPLSGR